MTRKSDQSTPKRRAPGKKPSKGTQVAPAKGKRTPEGLTLDQDMFCREFIIDFNATQAAIRAGYSPKAARQVACRLLTNENIQARIHNLKQASIERVELTADMVLKELMHIGFANLGDFMKKDISGKWYIDVDDVMNKAPHLMRGLVGLEVVDMPPSMEVDEKGNMQGREVLKTKLRLDKTNALKMLGQHVGLFREREILTTAELTALYEKHEAVLRQREAQLAARRIQEGGKVIDLQPVADGDEPDDDGEGDDIATDP